MGTTRNRGITAALALGLAVGAMSERPLAKAPPTEAVENAETVSSMRLVLNLSARRLHVYQDGERTRSYTVSVGKPGHQTPTGTYSISRIIWNPWWHPPNSEWARGKKPTPPGPNNPMGRVKMYFRNMYYIHGTPATGSLGEAVSHGCVRMSNSDAMELATLIHEYGSPNLSSSELASLKANSSRTREIRLQRQVPLEVVSSAADVVDGRLEIYASNGDFSHGLVREQAIQALRAAGFDLDTLDQNRLRDVVRMGQRATISVPLDDLVAPPAAAGTPASATSLADEQ